METLLHQDFQTAWTSIPHNTCHSSHKWPINLATAHPKDMGLVHSKGLCAFCAQWPRFQEEHLTFCEEAPWLITYTATVVGPLSQSRLPLPHWFHRSVQAGTAMHVRVVSPACDVDFDDEMLSSACMFVCLVESWAWELFYLCDRLERRCDYQFMPNH